MIDVEGAQQTVGGASPGQKKPTAAPCRLASLNSGSPSGGVSDMSALLAFRRGWGSRQRSCGLPLFSLLRSCLCLHWQLLPSWYSIISASDLSSTLANTTLLTFLTFPITQGRHPKAPRGCQRLCRQTPCLWPRLLCEVGTMRDQPHYHTGKRSNDKFALINC